MGNPDPAHGLYHVFGTDQIIVVLAGQRPFLGLDLQITSLPLRPAFDQDWRRFG
ncbi:MULTISPECIES: hypothetical protein [Roseobacter]|uniref:hypothetical protein n=1 Tax=Roseobacter TaxID=2433 RepID=UPI000160CDFD|nr:MULTISPECIES: hypothetical protein [Roseobacter]GIT86150.1 hypothetical protein ROBYS_11660 [Roseobacter sp. OBYS 0001]